LYEKGSKCVREVTKLSTDDNIELVRIGVSLPKNLLGTFDNLARHIGVANRSEAIRAALREYISNYSAIDARKNQVGVIIILFEHHAHHIAENLLDLQHDFLDIIQSSSHIHLDVNNCLEIVTVRGAGEMIRDLIEKIRAIPDVKVIKWVFTAIGAAIP
jgi:CopG family nickel-responsive transcriptional regulator